MPLIQLKAELCKTFGYTPLELAEQPADEVLQMYQALAVAARAQPKARRK